MFFYHPEAMPVDHLDALMASLRPARNILMTLAYFINSTFDRSG
jgi:hypothetical protein